MEALRVFLRLNKSEKSMESNVYLKLAIKQWNVWKEVVYRKDAQY